MTSEFQTSTRALILGAATHRFARGGPSGVTMREIASDTGLTLPTLYHHFTDKAGLYEACVADVLGAAFAQLSAAFAAGTSVGDRVRGVTACLLSQLAGESTLRAILQQEVALGRRPVERMLSADLARSIDLAFQDGSAKAASGPSPARLLIAFACGLASYGSGGPDPADPRAVEILLRSVDAGVAPR